MKSYVAVRDGSGVFLSRQEKDTAFLKWKKGKRHCLHPPITECQQNCLCLVKQKP